MTCQAEALGVYRDENLQGPAVLAYGFVMPSIESESQRNASG